MPTYTFRCSECGAVFDKILRVAQYNNPQSCSCGCEAKRIIVAPAIRTDISGYRCPVTDKWIEGRRAHAENLKRTGCRLYEPGETEQLKRSKVAEEAAFEKSLDETADRLIAELPAVKREKLIGEVEGGISATVVRQSVKESHHGK